MPASGRPFDAEEATARRSSTSASSSATATHSFAQVGGAHVACEWVSNILTKLLQRGRLAAYLEQSTRDTPYDKDAPPRAATASTAKTKLGPEFVDAMNEIFVYVFALARQGRGAGPRTVGRAATGEPEAAWRRSIRAKALDLLRGLLPAATSATSASTPPVRPTSS